MKKFISSLILFSFLPTSFAKVEDNCEYKSELKQCIEANSKEGAGNRTISDFICISDKNEQKILAQIILDKEFKKVDKDVEAYLGFLENNKDYYFGKNSQRNFIDAVDDIDKKFSLTGEFGKKYMNLCLPSNEDGVLSKTLGCYKDGIPSQNVKEYFIETDCRTLAQTKIAIAEQVAYDILKLNKSDVIKDEKKLYQQGQRTKYDKLIEIVMINIGYVERIWKKWPSVTRNPQGGG